VAGVGFERVVVECATRGPGPTAPQIAPVGPGPVQQVGSGSFAFFFSRHVRLSPETHRGSRRGGPAALGQQRTSNATRLCLLVLCKSIGGADKVGEGANQLLRIDWFM
jgi:hypothetical protein